MTTSSDDGRAPQPLPARPLTSGAREYLIAPHRGLGGQISQVKPMSAGEFDTRVDEIDRLEGVDIIRPLTTHSGRSLRSLAATGDADSPADSAFLIRVPDEKLKTVCQQASGSMLLEENSRFESHAQAAGVRRPASESDGAGRLAQYPFRVVSSDSSPLEGVTVMLRTWDKKVVSGRTGSDGEVVLNAAVSEHNPVVECRAIPRNWHWDHRSERPALEEGRINLIELKSLRRAMTGMRFGWGQGLMGLGELGPEENGAGIKIAVIDTGTDNSHPALSHIVKGLDLNSGIPEPTWNQDTNGHGTHTAGIIGARPTREVPFRGFAPDAEIHVYRIFPRGGADALLLALDDCQRNKVDVINLSLGQEGTSAIIQQKLEDLMLAGVCCVASAGNNGGPVMFPANSPAVLAISALGMTSDVEPGTWDESQIAQPVIDSIFSPKFTCKGQEIDIGAPGVGIISTLPGGAYGPQSGTSMSAPHVSGLIALLLAHCPAMRDYPAGTFGRILAVFDLLMQLANPYPALGQQRAGAGLPRLNRRVLKDLRPREQGMRNLMDSLPKKLAAKAIDTARFSLSGTKRPAPVPVPQGTAPLVLPPGLLWPPAPPPFAVAYPPFLPPAVQGYPPVRLY